jgi:hypothetical protein
VPETDKRAKSLAEAAAGKCVGFCDRPSMAIQDVLGALLRLSSGACIDDPGEDVAMFVP